jgi:hypothetical protein
MTLFRGRGLDADSLPKRRCAIRGQVGPISRIRGGQCHVGTVCGSVEHGATLTTATPRVARIPPHESSGERHRCTTITVAVSHA